MEVILALLFEKNITEVKDVTFLNILSIFIWEYILNDTSLEPVVENL